ncbi:biotin transporter BioY [Treponema sp. R6D11]
MKKKALGIFYATLLCYFIGTIYYGLQNWPYITFIDTIKITLLPFILVDFLKAIIAYLLSKHLKVLKIFQI